MPLAWKEMLAPDVEKPRRVVYQGFEKIDERYVLHWEIPSHSEHAVYHLTFDVETDHIYHACKGLGRHWPVERCGELDINRPLNQCCWHVKTVIKFLGRNKKRLADAKTALAEVYRLERELRELQTA